MKQIENANGDFYLAKFCKPEHNVLLGSNTIRLGTLNFYKNLDPSFYAGIADSEEGAFRYPIVSHEIGDPRTTQEAENIIRKLAGGSSSNVSIRFCEVNIQFPNCYIFCCQMVDQEPLPGDGLQFDKSYTSHYTIPNPEEFCQYLGERLTEQIRTRFFTPVSRKHVEICHEQQREELTLSAWHRPVQYISTKSRRISNGQLEDLRSDIPTELQPVFFKPEKFSLNREYRFAFLFHFDDKNLEVQNEPFDLKTTYRSKLRRILRFKNNTNLEPHVTWTF